MSPILDLPNELLLEIFKLAHPGCRSPLNILLVSANFYRLYTQLIYSHLEFTKISQLTRFLETFGPSFGKTIPHPIRSAKVDLYNDMNLGLYSQLRDFFSLCAAASGAEIDGENRVILEELTFRFHTHTLDPTLYMIYEALARANPRVFTWMGPDPPHHFSAAMVPGALSHVLRALTTQTNLTHVTLTHVKPPDNGTILLLPRFPSLKSLTLSQVIFLHPDIVVDFIVNSDKFLESVQLIDAYKQSIWGPRLRRSHIETAAKAYIMQEQAEEGMIEDKWEKLVQRIRQVVICQGKIERIIGGDRMLGDGVLI